MKSLPLTFLRLSCASSVLSIMLFGMLPAHAHEIFSNRHQLSGCTQQSIPVIVPYTTASTIRLGLPADINAPVEVTRLIGVERDVRRSSPRNSESRFQPERDRGRVTGAAELQFHGSSGC